MKNEFNLSVVLENVANGKTPISKAKNIIEKYYIAEDKEEIYPPVLEGKKIKPKNKAEKTTHLKTKYSSHQRGKDKLKSAFNNLKMKVNFDEILKRSTKFVNQISENVPQKIQDNLAPMGFTLKIEGVDSKISVFRGIDMSLDNVIHDNQVVGSQWLNVHFIEKCTLEQNKFMATQMTEFSLIRSDLSYSQFSLSRLSYVTFQESCFVQNKLSLSTWSDVSVTESDFTENSLKRTNLSGTIINASRLSKLNLSHVNFKDSEFESCDIQGVDFENCDFKECSFHHIQCVSEARIKISGINVVGKQFAHCQTPEEFLNLLIN